MEIVTKVSETVLPIGDKLDILLVPVLMLFVAVLFIFSRYSYRLFKILLPLTCIAIGSMVGANLVGPVIEKAFPDVANYVNPAYIGGIACAAIIAFLCLKLLKLAIVITGAGAGYLFVSGIVHNLLRATKFISDILLNTDMETAIFFSTIITILSVIVTAVLFHFFFKPIYILATSIGSGAAALGVAAIFMFAGTAIMETAVLVSAGIGGFIGLVLACKQISYYRYSN